ncbi:hypothetical protein AB0L41_23380 [Amycolatopsis mediterranei]|uniref:hypothetical protein n=1 Tax=Amycolatopsis mediterranei TaxID=33910 RepID=UPI00342C3D00
MTTTSQPSVTRRIRGSTIRKWVLIGALTGGLLIVVGWLVLPALITTQSTRNARDVFCLQPAQRGALADAATALGFAKAGGAVDLVLADDTSIKLLNWRKERPEEFSTACDALSTVQGKPVTPPGGVTGVAGVILPFLAALLSAALTYVSTRRQSRATVGQADAKEVRELVTAYRDAVNLLLDDRKKPPGDLPAGDAAAAHDALTGRLSALAERKPKWTRLAEAVELLRTGELTSDFDQRLRARNTRADRIELIDRWRALVAEVTDTGFLVADALARDDDVDDGALTRPLRKVVAS